MIILEKRYRHISFLIHLNGNQVNIYGMRKLSCI